MSLLTRLWLGVMIIMLLLLGANLAICTRTAQEYLSAQIAKDASDSSAALAISISQQGKNLALSEGLVNALFASGRFEMIQYRDSRGNILFARHAVHPDVAAPAWFADLFPLGLRSGTAQVVEPDGAEGVVSLQMNPQGAYLALWQETLSLAATQLAVSALLGIALTTLLRWAQMPLRAIVNQAAAIGQRRFVRLPKLSVPELRVVGDALNVMVERVQTMYAEQAERIEALRDEANYDSMTALPNRNLFVAQLRGALQEEHRPECGGVLVIRLLDLAGVNRRLGRERADSLVKAAAELIGQRVQQNAHDLFSGRLNGADFAMIFEGSDKEGIRTLGNQMLELLKELYGRGLSDREQVVAIGATCYQKGESGGAVLLRADNALMQAETIGPAMVTAFGQSGGPIAWSAEDWRDEIDHALETRAFEINTYPVLYCGGVLLHQEVMLRLQSRKGAILGAGLFMPSVIRLERSAEIDLVALELALSFAHEKQCDVAINVSPRSLNREGFLEAFAQRLLVAKNASRRLWVEISEKGMDLQKDFSALERLTLLLENHDAHFGIEHFGKHFAALPQLYSLKLHYIKLDGSFVSGIDLHPGNQRFVKAVVDIAHSMGIDVIAERVTTREEWKSLAAMGVRGVTGPAVTALFENFTQGT